MRLLPFLLLLGGVAPSYQEAVPGVALSFPRDHFEHPAFRTEWWYYTGNVWAADGHRFGFELVFFRQGNRLGARDNASAWRVDDLYLANVALTDIDGKRFSPHERLNRGGPGVAGASFAEQRIWNGNWSDVWSGGKQTLTALTEDFSFRFECKPVKAFVLQGDRGLSQKSEGLGHASYYVSFPRLAVTGTVHAGDRVHQVSGQAWMDHEWFSHDLGANQAGWDWFSVQLDNNTELMIYELRRKDGTVDSYSSGTYIGPRGDTRHLTASDFALKPTEWWVSNKTGAKYPVKWSVRVPSLQIDLECRAKFRDQELAGKQGAKYWEGAVDFSGSHKGVGYLEMTGYDKPLKLD